MSLRKSIYDALVTDLDTEISTANGYNTDLANKGGALKVMRASSLKTLPAVVVTFHREDKDPDRTTYVDNRISFTLLAFVEDLDEDDATSVEDQIDDLVADLENRILTIKDTQDPPLGITQIDDILLEGHTKYVVDGDVDLGAEVFGTIVYRHSISTVNN